MLIYQCLCLLSVPCCWFIMEACPEKSMKYGGQTIQYRPIHPSDAKRYEVSVQWTPGDDGPSPSFDWTKLATTEPGGRVPVGLNVTAKALNSFSANATNQNNCCAISGSVSESRKRDSFSALMLAACHVVPPEHFDAYPFNPGCVGQIDEKWLKRTKFLSTWDPSINASSVASHSGTVQKPDGCHPPNRISDLLLCLH